MVAQNGDFVDRQKAIRHAVGMTSTQKLALYAINSFIGKNASCWPSIDTLCDATALSRSGLKKVLRQLEASGALRTSRGGGSSSSQYEIDLSAIPTRSQDDPVATEPSHTVVDTRSQDDPTRSHSVDRRSHGDPKRTVKDKEQETKTRCSNSKYSWKTLTAETMLEVVKADSPDEFLRWDVQGIEAFGWIDSSVARINRLCLWVSSLRAAKAKGGNAAALLTSALKAGRTNVINAADEDAARAFLRRRMVSSVVTPMNVADHQTEDVGKLDQFQRLATATINRPPATITPPIRRTKPALAKSA